MTIAVSVVREACEHDQSPDSCAVTEASEHDYSSDFGVVTQA